MSRSSAACSRRGGGQCCFIHSVVQVANLDIVDIVLLLLAAFYVIAGIVASRATLTGMLIDRAIAAINAKPPPKAETLRGFAMLIMTALVLLSGAALVIKLKLALALFLACLLFQAAYLFVIAPRYLDPFDAPDATGRRQSINAFIIYTLATGFVAWAHGRDRLLDIGEVSRPALMIVCGLVIAHLGYVAYQTVRIFNPKPAPDRD